MSVKVLKTQSPREENDSQKNAIEKKLKEKTEKLKEMELDMKKKIQEICELKCKNHDLKKIVKFFTNNVDNLENLEEIKKQLDVKDEKIKEIKKQLKEEKTQQEVNSDVIKKKDSEIAALKESLERYKKSGGGKGDINKYEEIIKKQIRHGIFLRNKIVL